MKFYDIGPGHGYGNRMLLPLDEFTALRIVKTENDLCDEFIELNPHWSKEKIPSHYELVIYNFKNAAPKIELNFFTLEDAYIEYTRISDFLLDDSRKVLVAVNSGCKEIDPAIKKREKERKPPEWVQKELSEMFNQDTGS